MNLYGIDMILLQRFVGSANISVCMQCLVVVVKYSLLFL